MTPEEIIKIFNLSRLNAAQDLGLSNELLEIVDKLVVLAEQHPEIEESVAAITQNLVGIAIKLTKQSKEMTVLVAKAVGAS